MAILLTLPRSHNTDLLGGRISHQPVAQSPPAPQREEITADAIRGQSGIKRRLTNECRNAPTYSPASLHPAVLADVWQANWRG